MHLKLIKVIVMDGEINAFVTVWASVLASVVYCYAVARIGTKGLVRLFMFLPVICLFLLLPFNLTSVHLGCPTVFFIPWLTNTKILLLFCVTMYIYVGLDLLLMAYIAGFLVGRKIEAPFDYPFLSSSLRDFWGRRWNRVVSENLKSAVYWPMYNYSSPKMGVKWAVVQALIATFLVSALLHVLLMYYLGRAMPTWRTTRSSSFMALSGV